MLDISEKKLCIKFHRAVPTQRLLKELESQLLSNGLLQFNGTVLIAKKFQASNTKKGKFFQRIF